MLKRAISKTISGILTLILLLSLTACVSGSDEVFIPEGFTASETVTGGQNYNNANLCAISTEKDESVLSITLDFVIGSARNSMDEMSAATVPVYSVHMLHDPERLAIGFDSLSYTDYTYAKDLSAGRDRIYDVFSVKEPDGGVTVYFQLKANSAFSVHEEGSALVVDMVRLDDQPAADEFYYHVAADMEREYTSGSIALADEELSPSMTRTAGRVIFLSAPLNTIEEAEQRLNELKETCSTELYIIALYANDLPEYSHTAQGVVDAKPVEISGSPSELDTVIANGLYYTQTPDGHMLYGERRNGAVWELCSTDSNAENPVVNMKFENIEAAAYSPDGARLAVLENAADGSHLYVFDAKSGEVTIDLSEVGFGKRISRFVWNETGTAIYAVGGTGTLKVNMYDFRIADEAKRYSAIYPEYTEESGLGTYDGFVYFVLTEQADSEIFMIRPEGGAHKLFSRGSAFSFSPDKKTCAITTANSVAAGSEMEFILLNMETKEETKISAEFPVYDFVWSYDSRFVYFTENTLSDANGEEGEVTAEEQTPEPTEQANAEYPFVLYRYDTETGSMEELCRMKYGTVYASPSDYSLYLPYYDIETMGEKICATYVIDASLASE